MNKCRIETRGKHGFPYCQPRVYFIPPLYPKLIQNLFMCVCASALFLSKLLLSQSADRTKSSVKINTFSRRQAFYYEQRVTLKNIFARVLMDERKNIQVSLGFIEKRDPLLCWFTLPNVSCSYWIQFIYQVFQSCAQLRHFFARKKISAQTPCMIFLV